MLRNYLKVALRNLRKRKGFALINILGLAIGIACCLLIAMYVFDEISYDQFHEKADRIYRVTQTTETSAKEEEGATTPFPVGPALQDDFSGQMDKAVRFFDMQEDIRTMINVETDEAFRVDHFYVVDSTFFDVFSVDMVHGDPETALDEPMSVVITEEQSARFFGNENSLGKQLSFKSVKDFTVTGVIESLPPTSHMEIDMLVSFNTLPELYGSSDFLDGWFWNPCWTYVLLDENTAPAEIEQQFPNFVERNYADREEGETVSLGLQPITDIHLHSNLDQEMKANGSIFYVYLFSVVAFLILVIACINFMNLSTARATERAPEVGMRKVLGANRRQLFGQFMGESFLMTLLGFVLALGLVYISLPFFNNFTGKVFEFAFLGSGKMIIALITLFIAVTLLAGMYPAIYLSGFNPTTIMHGSKGSSGDSNGVALRRGLVIFQFALSVMLIVGTVIVYLQLQHMQDKRLGFDKERVVVMPIKQTLIAWNFDEFQEKAPESSNILNVSGTGKLLGSEEQTFRKYSPANQPEAPPTNMSLRVTHGFIDTYDIEVLAGRSFSRDHPTDSENAILINRSMLTQIGAETPQDALGHLFYFTTGGDERREFQVIGVVEDFNYTSIKKEISPLVINLEDEERRIVGSIEYAAARLAPGSIQDGLEDLRATFKEINHIDPFTYSFHDEELEKIYASETRMGNVAGVFALICVFVACLGLFGLASFTSSKRTKEIGIRKTLGATVPDIVTLLTKDYLKLVVVANIIAWPVIYYLAVQWLQDFPHRISLGWNTAGIFFLVAVVSLVICLATVSYQSIRAALFNPVNSIQQE